MSYVALFHNGKRQANATPLGGEIEIYVFSKPWERWSVTKHGSHLAVPEAAR